MWLYSVSYISVGSSTCFGCWHPSSGAGTDCNYSLWHCSTGSTTIRSRWWVVRFQLKNESSRPGWPVPQAVITVCTSSWWWVSTAETCRAAYRNVINWISRNLLDNYSIWFTMHGPMNIKKNPKLISKGRRGLIPTESPNIEKTLLMWK